MSVRDTDTDIELRWHAAHWGPYLAASTPDGLVVRPHPDDPDPSPILANLPDAAHHPTRVAQPMVRKGWLDRGPGPSLERGAEAFVPLDWPAALDLVANELRRVRDERGGAGIYGGSYGWSSAGRFHHAQSQLHRFLGTTGGYVRSVNTYSSGCANVILPHVLAEGEKAAKDWLTWPEIEEHTELVVAFGGMARKNASVSSGGVSRHLVQGHLERARERGAQFVLVSPLRDDLPGEVGAEWIPIRPATDVALMLALAHTLVREGLHDREFLDRCTAGYERFERYLLGETDGVAKSPRWAEETTGISAGEITALARRMAGHRTLVTVSHSLQRSEFGEQPVWMGVVLAAMLGQLGLPGGGFQYA
ncbi:MAG TPA: molybdopterin-dependent oxidoreductase, partial [Candidatus Binatia bacterium]|nr:molybdopterin-dependent oxidoreductase [Candidatus Binatia bacterium]